jgi:hypothetical protein
MNSERVPTPFEPVGLPNPEEPVSTPVVELAVEPSGEGERAEFSTEDERQRLRIRSLAQDIRERRRYAVYAYRITRSWVCFLISISFVQLIAKC